jgi:hypothetical protein
VARRRWARGGGLLAAVVLLAWGELASASAVATFRLTNVDEVGSSPVLSVLARVLPPGAVLPRDEDVDPPTILDPSTGYISSGFNPDDLQVVLGEGTTSGGELLQVVKLDFGPEGFAPGGRLYFQLKVNPTFGDTMRLVLPENVTNVAMEAISVTPPPDVDPPQVPEPRSILVWMALPLLGLWRARVAGCTFSSR